MNTLMHHIDIVISGPVREAVIYLNGKEVPIKRSETGWNCQLSGHPVPGALDLIALVWGRKEASWEMKVRLDRRSLIRFQRQFYRGMDAFRKEIPFAG